MLLSGLLLSVDAENFLAKYYDMSMGLVLRVVKREIENSQAFLQELKVQKEEPNLNEKLAKQELGDFLVNIGLVENEHAHKR